MIGGIFVQARFAQGGENAADLGVEEGDVGVVVGEVLTDHFRSARPGSEPFIAARQIASC